MLLKQSLVDLDLTFEAMWSLGWVWDVCSADWWTLYPQCLRC